MRRNPLKSWEKAEIAVEWLRPLQEGRPRTPIAQLAERYGNRDPAVISRAIQAAFREGLVEVRRRDPVLPEVTRNSSLEARLQERYRELEVAVVVEPGRLSKDDGEDVAMRSDLVHKQLGRAAAEVVSGGLLREGDRIGLGSGRSVYYTVSALEDHQWLAVSGVTLVSLTGALFPHSHAAQLGIGVSGVGLDADFHVALMGTRFARPVTCFNVAYPIASEDETQLQRIRANTPLDDDRYRDITPTLAIVGVGVLEGQHRFVDLDKDKFPQRAMRSILGPLRRLADYVEQYRSPSWVPVGDIANWLFWNPPPSDISVAEGDRQAISELISEVNRNLLTVRANQLRMIKRIMLVAGTETKGLAIRHLLAQSDLRVRVLITDVTAARVILDS